MKDIKVCGITVDSFFIVATAACLTLGLILPSRMEEALIGAGVTVLICVADMLIQNVFWKEKK